jgi:predicted RNA-binding Zn-ribbon protein involved in translation (DUF1610 family)
MVVGYYLSVADSRSRMFRDDSSLKKCPTCGYRLDFFAHNPQYGLRSADYDLCATYDGQLIGSLAFKRFCEEQNYSSIIFREFDLDEIHFHVIFENIVPFDAIRRKTRFEKLCPTCGNYESVVGAKPAYLRLSSPLVDGLYRSDLLFASGNEKGPAEFAAVCTKEKMLAAGIRGVTFHEAKGLE